jgi:hypothetical protein
MEIRNMSLNTQSVSREDHELPLALTNWGWRYHHLGIPTDIPRPGEVYIEKYRMYVSGFRTSPYGVEWMRFDPESPIPELVQKVPHLAFVVDNLETALVGKDVLTAPDSPSDELMVAMIIHNCAPIELMQFHHR